jgi:hypothetical protein
MVDEFKFDGLLLRDIKVRKVLCVDKFVSLYYIRGRFDIAKIAKYPPISLKLDDIV